MSVGAAVYGSRHAVHRARQQMQWLYQRVNSATVRRCVGEGGRGSLGTATDSWTGLVVRRRHVLYHVCSWRMKACRGLCVITESETHRVL
jgi:hypothetical protein